MSEACPLRVEWSPVPGEANASAQQLLIGAIASTVLAAERLPDLTGILAVNFRPTVGEIEFEVEGVGLFNTTTHPFYIQERVVPVIEILRNNVAFSREEAPHMLIDGVLSLIMTIINRGIWQHTYGIDYNYGRSTSGTLLHIDTGEYQEGTNWKLTDPAEWGANLLRDTLPDLESEFLELAAYLTVEANRRLRV
jgi:hypothetical protein